MEDIESLGNKLLTTIKSQQWFPFKTGHLKDHAVKGEMVDDNTYCITFDTTIAPYIEYLEEGTTEHDIPFAFVGKGNWVWWYPFHDGVPFLFGMGGRFNGKFHPGSTKHKDFIKTKCVDEITKYICSAYNGVATKE